MQATQPTLDLSPLAVLTVAGLDQTIQIDFDGLAANRRTLPRARRESLTTKIASRASALVGRQLDRLDAFARRTLDIVGAGAAITALSPLFVAAAAAIKLESRGPVFFVQERVGEKGCRFPMFKFRSMRTTAEAERAAVVEAEGAEGDVRFKSRRDPRVTRVGRLLRRFSIDELPQLFNVLRGEMSLVGPRPPIPAEVAQYSASDWRRLDVRPGLTCIWQVSGRADIPFEGQVLLDVEYIRTQSLLTDLRILFATVPAVLSGKGAY